MNLLFEGRHLHYNRNGEITVCGFNVALTIDTKNTDDAREKALTLIRDGLKRFPEIEVNGPFFFGAADRFKHVLSLIVRKPKVLILRMRTVLSLDATALRALEDVHEQARREGTVLLLAGIHAQPLIVMDRAGFLEKVGVENVFESVNDALKRARAIVGTSQGTWENATVQEVSWERPGQQDGSGGQDGPKDAS